MPTAPRAGRAIVLGSGAGGGVPQWNCGCRNCGLARDGDPRVLPRSQASLAMTGNGTDWALANASPDLRAQLSSCRGLAPPMGGRGSPITDVILTGSEIDQVGGLLTLREGHSFALHATAETQAILAANPIFGALRADIVRRAVLEPPAPLEIAGLHVEVLPLPGKAPLYLEAETSDLSLHEGGTLGLLARPRRGGRSLAYVPGCAALTPELHELLEAADIVLLDGTLFEDDELVRTRTGAKTGRRMGHLPISGEGGTLALLAGLAPRRRIYTHINNTNPVLLQGSRERHEVESMGIEIAFDGMEIEL